jgi:hypothetical protein
MDNVSADRQNRFELFVPVEEFPISFALPNQCKELLVMLAHTRPGWPASVSRIGFMSKICQEDIHYTELHVHVYEFADNFLPIILWVSALRQIITTRLKRRYFVQDDKLPV